MEMFATAEFWTGLLTIIWINFLLSGDNAVMIALASHSLPPVQRKRAVLWGGVVAIVLRVVLTIVAVELFKLPFLKIIGGLLLLWIAIQLLMPGPTEDSAKVKEGKTLVTAVRAIMVADLVMSLDNVIGVMAAAKGNLVLLVLGIAIGIPLIMFSSALILRIMDRFPIIITLGAALLGYIAGEMVVADHAVVGWVQNNAIWLQDIMPGPLEVSIAGLVGAAVVVVVGKLLAARVASGEIINLAQPRNPD